MKLKHLHYYDELYLHHFVFILNVTSNEQLEKILLKYPEAHKTYLKEKSRDKKGLDISTFGGVTLTNDAMTGSAIIVVKQKKDSEFYAILAHECFHAMSHMFNTRGVAYDDKEEASNEHFAYYLSHLIDKALK